MPKSRFSAEQLRQARNRLRDEFLGISGQHHGLKSTDPLRNVVAIGIGPRLKKDAFIDDEETIRFYVQQKVDVPSEVPPGHLLPSKEKESGIPTDVIETGRFRCALGSSAAAIGIIQPGASCGVRFGRSGDAATGTIGPIVRRGKDIFYLSAAHVLGQANGFLMGSPLLCPAPPDLPELTDDPVHLHESHQAVHGARPEISEAVFHSSMLVDLEPLSLLGPNQMDAALAQVSSSAKIETKILKTNDYLTQTQPVEPAKDMVVQKVGRATGLTKGVIREINAPVRVDFPLGFLQFEDQILIEGDKSEPFAWEGDSGSLVYHVSNQNGKKETLAVALLVGFSLPDANHDNTKSYAVATPLSSILKRWLDVELMTDGSS